MSPSQIAIIFFNQKNYFCSLFLLTEHRPLSTINNVDVPRFDMQQADVASLISSLIGTAVPTNNIGKLPLNYLNVSEVGTARFFNRSSNQNGSRFKQLLQEFVCTACTELRSVLSTVDEHKKCKRSFVRIQKLRKQFTNKRTNDYDQPSFAQFGSFFGPIQPIIPLI